MKPEARSPSRYVRKQEAAEEERAASYETWQIADCFRCSWHQIILIQHQN